MNRPTKIALATAGLAIAGTLATVSADAQRRGGYPHQDGQALYEHVCQGCHMPGGTGATGASSGYPALAANRKLSAQLYPVVVILRGQRAMPSFSDLNDAQVAAVTNYIRTSFGNAYANPVTPEQVKGLRGQATQQNAQRPG